MDARKSTIQQFFFGTDPLVVPVYQRIYTWKHDDCARLFDDILAIAHKPKATHFVGSIVDVKHANSIVLIDGQQRVTTISLLLLALKNAIVAGKIDASNPTTVQQIEQGYLVNPFAPEEHRVRLKPFRDDSKAFSALFASPEDYVNGSLVTSNYLYFYDRILNKHEATPEEILDAIRRLTIVHITLEPEYGDDAQLVFESINSTGVSLTEADKVRNFVLMNLDAFTQEEYYKNYWSKIETNTGNLLEDFVRYFLTCETGNIPNKLDVYRKFKELVANHYPDDIKPLLESMTLSSKYFHRIKTCSVGSPEANKVMGYLEALDNTTSYPFLLSYLAHHESTGESEIELVRVLQTLDVFLFRRTMRGLYNTGLNKVFSNLHKRVMHQIRDDYKYSDVLIYILENAISYYEFPKDEAFLQSFAVRDIYNMKSNYKQYYFVRMEEALNKEAVDIKQKMQDKLYTIEHIMPQTLTDEWRDELGGENPDSIHEKWLHTAANLTLTAYNSEYSNRSFKEKRDGIPAIPDMKGFRDSCIALNNFVSKCERWTETEMESRLIAIQKQALLLWPYPNTTFVPVEIQDEMIPLDSDYIFKGRYIKYYSFLGTRTDVASWADALTRIVRSFYELDSAPLYKLLAAGDQWYLDSKPHENELWNKIVDGMYIKVGSSTNDKLSILRKLLALYGLESDEIAFSLYSKKENTSNIEE